MNTSDLITTDCGVDVQQVFNTLCDHIDGRISIAIIAIVALFIVIELEPFFPKINYKTIINWSMVAVYMIVAMIGWLTAEGPYEKITKISIIILILVIAAGLYKHFTGDK